MMRLPPRKSRSSRSTPSLFNYLLRPSGALLAAALKTSSKSRLRKKNPICVDLKDLWTSFVPALEEAPEAPPQILPTLNFSATPYSKTRISGFLKRTVKRKTFFSSE